MEDHGLDASGADSLGPGAFGADMTGDDEIPPTGTPSGAQTQSSRRGAASKVAYSIINLKSPSIIKFSFTHNDTTSLVFVDFF